MMFLVIWRCLDNMSGVQKDEVTGLADAVESTLRVITISCVCRLESRTY